MLKLKWEKHNTPSLGWKLLTGREEGKALGPLSSNHSGSGTRSGAELAEQSFRAVAPPLQQSRSVVPHREDTGILSPASIL